MLHFTKILCAVILTATLSTGLNAQPEAVTPHPGVETVNINTADAETLARVLAGIGEKKSQAIVDYRTQNGAFKSLADLKQVYGIGEKTLERNQDKIVFSEPTAVQDNSAVELKTPVAAPH